MKNVVVDLHESITHNTETLVDALQLDEAKGDRIIRSSPLKATVEMNLSGDTYKRLQSLLSPFITAEVKDAEEPEALTAERVA